MSSRSKGFSLIELIVVLAIIAVLITVALPRYQGSVENSKVVALKSNLKSMRETIGRFYEDKGRYPDSLQELVDARYLRAVPVDPITESATTWVMVDDVRGDEHGVADVQSGARGSSPDGVAYSEL